MDLLDGAVNSAATALPCLISSLPEYDARITTSEQTLLPQVSPLSAVSLPLLSTDDVEEEKKEGDETYRFRKVKMFEMAPSDDPELEERRQRALYAKQNRDMKKREEVKLQREVAALCAAKEQCQTELTRVYRMAQCQQHKIEELEQCLSDTRQQMKDKEKHIRNSQEKMSRLKAHLEVIADGMEENNVSRRMLLNLLAQIR